MVADPYQVLGVSHSATEDEIRQAYRRLAKKYHPDLNPSDAQAAQKMNEVNEAYDLLKIRRPISSSAPSSRLVRPISSSASRVITTRSIRSASTAVRTANKIAARSSRTAPITITPPVQTGMRISSRISGIISAAHAAARSACLARSSRSSLFLTFSSRCSAAAPIVQARIPAIKAAAPHIPSRMAAPARTPAGTGAPTVKTAPVRKAR